MTFVLHLNKKNSFQLGMVALALGVLTLHKKGVAEYSDFWDCLLCLYPISQRKELDLDSELAHFLDHFDEMYDLYKWTGSKKELVSLHHKKKKYLMEMWQFFSKSADVNESFSVDWSIEYIDNSQWNEEQRGEHCGKFSYTASTTSNSVGCKLLLFLSLGLLILFEHNIMSKQMVEALLFNSVPFNMKGDSVIEEYVFNLLGDMKTVIRLRGEYPEMFQQEYLRICYRTAAIHELNRWLQRDGSPRSNHGEWQVSFTGW